MPYQNITYSVDLNCVCFVWVPPTSPNLYLFLFFRGVVIAVWHGKGKNGKGSGIKSKSFIPLRNPRLAPPATVSGAVPPSSTLWHPSIHPPLRLWGNCAVITAHCTLLLHEMGGTGGWEAWTCWGMRLLATLQFLRTWRNGSSDDSRAGLDLPPLLPHQLIGPVVVFFNAISLCITIN